MPATYDTLERDTGEVLDSEEKAVSRGTVVSEEKSASKGTSVRFDSPVGQVEQLLKPSTPAAALAPPTPWEASPGVKVDWTWKMAEETPARKGEDPGEPEECCRRGGQTYPGRRPWDALGPAAMELRLAILTPMQAHH